MTGHHIVALLVLAGVLAILVLRPSGPEPDAADRITDTDVPTVAAVPAPAAGSGTKTTAPPQPQPSAAPDERLAETDCDGGACGSQLRHDCDPRKITCQRSAPLCEQGEVLSVVGNCFGACVPIQSCRCDGPDECPLHEQYTCLMSRHHCTPYL